MLKMKVPVIFFVRIKNEFWSMARCLDDDGWLRWSGIWSWWREGLEVFMMSWCRSECRSGSSKAILFINGWDMRGLDRTMMLVSCCWYRWIVRRMFEMLIWCGEMTGGRDSRDIIGGFGWIR
jgi:hypothetical protein